MFPCLVLSPYSKSYLKSYSYFWHSKPLAMTNGPCMPKLRHGDEYTKTKMRKRQVHTKRSPNANPAQYYAIPRPIPFSLASHSASIMQNSSSKTIHSTHPLPSLLPHTSLDMLLEQHICSPRTLFRALETMPVPAYSYLFLQTPSTQL